MQPNDEEFREKLEGERQFLAKQRIPSGVEARSAYAMTPQYKNASHGKDNRAMKTKIMRAFDTGNYKRLQNQLSSFVLEPAAIDNFFAEWGGFLLRHALSDTHDDKALLFLHQHMPCHMLLAVLREEDFENIKGFLAGEAGCEKSPLFQEKDLTERFLKFKALLKIDPTLKEFFEKPDFENYMTDGMRDTFNQVIKSNTPKHSK